MSQGDFEGCHPVRVSSSQGVVEFGVPLKGGEVSLIFGGGRVPLSRGGGVSSELGVPLSLVCHCAKDIFEVGMSLSGGCL